MDNDLTTASFWDTQWRATTKTALKSLLNSNWELDKFLSKELEDIPPGGKLLELGGAPGNMLARQHRIRPDLEYHCLDFSETGLVAAQRVFESNGICGELHKKDIRNWPEGLEKFDVVTSFGLIEHFDDFGAIVVEHLRFCRPGGKVVITVPNYAARFVHWSLRKFSEETLRTHNLQSMSPEALMAAIESHAVDCSTGGFGLAKLPHSHYDSGFGGYAYHLACKLWNGLISALSALTGRRINVRFWPSQLYLTGKRSLR